MGEFGTSVGSGSNAHARCRIYAVDPSTQAFNSTTALAFSGGLITDTCIAFYSKTIVTGGLNNVGTTENRFYLGGAITGPLSVSKKIAIK